MRATFLSAVLIASIAFAGSPAEAAEPDAPSNDEGEDESEGDPGEELVKTKAKPKRNKSRNDEACDYRSPMHWHEVEAGEHLGLIAGLYGVLSKDIIALNPALASNPNHVRVGQKLAVCPDIPPREILELEHVVGPGDTFNKIAF